jgi:hypothetical protein
MESIADYFLFLWHASYGYTGTLNDNTILSFSPFMERLLNGSFHGLEDAAAVIPFMIKEEKFNKAFVLLDVIYPSYSRFVRGIKVHATREEKKYTSWQEGARKDVERAFRVLKNTWHFLDRPILLHDLNDISNRVVSCLLLHNMLVTDRVMQEASDTYYNYHERYDPSVGAHDPFDVEVQQPADLARVQNAPAVERRAVIGINNAPPTVQATRSDGFAELNDLVENRRPHKALMANLNT